MRPGDIVIMDNLGSHKGKAVRQAIRWADAKLFLLPKYSPDLNPIEQVYNRQIPSKPRAVHISRELRCPSQHQAGLELLLNKVRAGQDLSPHQSRKFPNAADYNDGLFADWGIHHFHLGTSLRADGLSESTGHLLFARVTADDFYCITVMGHKSWSKRELLEINHRNWPQTIAAAQPKSPSGLRVIGLSQRYADAEVAEMRKYGINPLTQRGDGTIHVPAGGGQTTDQKSATVAMQRASLVKLCRDLEKRTRKSVPEFLKMARRQGVEMKPPISLRLEIVAGKTDAVEVFSKIRIELGIPFDVAALVSPTRQIGPREHRFLYG